MSAFRRIRATIAAVATGALVAASVVVAAAPAATAATLPSPPPRLQSDDKVVTSDPLPTVQIDNGYVWAQTTVGTTVYAAGQFANARAPLAAPGTSLTPRSNILAFDITTGGLLPFAPSVNGTIKSIAASPDGSRIYIGGSFNSVNGQTRWNFAALDAATGQLVPGFAPAVGGSGVYAIATKGDVVYLGGLFTQTNSTARKNVAAVSATNGALLSWAPQTDRQVDAMVIDPAGSHVILAGRFAAVDGNDTLRGLAAIGVGSGQADTSWAANQTIKNGWSGTTSAGKAGIFALAADDTGVYGTGWVYAGASVGNLEGTFAVEAGTGEVRWIADCLGDHYGVYSTGEVVYTTSHTHACSTMGQWPEQNPRTHRYAEAYTTEVGGTLARNPHAGGTYQNWEGTPAPSAYAWSPDWAVGVTSGLGQAGLSITGAGDFISIAGEFRSVNFGQYEGIVRFAKNPPGGAKDGPRTTATTWASPSAQSPVPGRVRVTIPATWDRDDKDLTYELLRVGAANPVDSTVVTSGWWYQPAVSLDESGLTPGQTYTYSVRVRDTDGNVVTSSAATVSVAAGAPAPYTNAVLDDAPSLYYALGSSTVDLAGNNPPNFGTGVNTTVTGVVAGSTAGFSRVNGTSNGRISSTSTVTSPTTFSTELWFQTTTTSGGKLIGYGNARTGSSGSYDRHVYMRNDGRLVFGTHPGTTRTILSPASYNDGQWHHVVSSQSAEGMALYVDGVLVASDPTTTTSDSFTGYWRIGGDNLSGWPNRPSSDWFNGAIDEVAVYPTALTATQVSSHYALGAGLQPPTPRFTETLDGLDVAFDGSTSTAHGTSTVVDYAWDFGDGNEGTGITAEHTYGASGTFDVSLTVRDNRGLMSTSTKTITVLGPNSPPTAAFVATTSGLSIAVDGSDSADTDGNVVGYSWNWGDDSPAGEGSVANHTYAAAGTYPVTLTVTDDRGGVDTFSVEVEVIHAAPVAEFSISSTGRTIDVDASASSASDGASLDYSWDWGDGSPVGTGAVASHTYPGDGPFTVTLTVTDSLGAVTTSTEEIQVTATVYAILDDFNRVVASGWGAAEVGGIWAPLAGSASVASVSGSEGVLTMPVGGTRAMALQGTMLQDTASTVEYTMHSTPANGAAYVGLVHRQTGSNGYTVHAWHRNNGSVWLVAQSAAGTVATRSISGMTWNSGDEFILRTEVTGTGPTAIRAKIWKSGASEPTQWQLDSTDSAAGLQQAGFMSVRYSLAGSAAGPATVAVDRVAVQNLTEVEVPNVAPVAAFSSSVTGLDVSVDAAASADADGSIASYTWNWGDGTPAGEGATATHAYAEAGTYAVSLTVVDDAGADHTVAQDVTVTEVEVPNVAPVAAFSSSVTGLDVSVDAAASADADGSIASYTWNWGDGTPAGEGATATHAYAEAGTYAVSLTVVDDVGADHTVTQDVIVSAGPAGEEDVIIRDDFERTTVNGWGTADLGGAWAISGGGTSAASVANGVGAVTLAAGSTRMALLNATPVESYELTAEISVDAAPSTGATYVGVVARHTASGYYVVHAWLRTDGRIWLVAQRGSTTLASYAVPGVTYAAGDEFTMKVSVTEAAGTRMDAKIWRSGDVEPASWQLAAVDTTAALQTSGSIGLRVNRTSASTSGTVVSVDKLQVTAHD